MTWNEWAFLVDPTSSAAAHVLAVEEGAMHSPDS